MTTMEHYPSPPGTYDPVTVEIFSKALDNIASEMGLVMMRTSGSPAIAEAVDFSTYIADARGDIIAYSGYVTMYLGTARRAVRHILDSFPPDRIHPGDMFICNDPFTTGVAHQVDVGVVRPIFAGSEVLAWCWAEAHVADFGGISPGGFAPMATETYGEALRLPGVKIVDQGRLIDDVWRMIETNIRVPQLVLNDIQCFIAACNRCDDRLRDLADEYGIEDFTRYVAISRQLAERAVRRRIASLPNGVYEADEYVEHNGHTNDLYRVHCKLTVDDDRMEFDFSESSPQTNGFINTSAPVTYGGAITAVLTTLLPDLPVNQGTLRPFDVVTRPGTICDVQMPAPCSSGHMETGNRVVKVSTKLLAQLQADSDDSFVRDHVLAPGQDSWNGVVLYAPDESGIFVPFLDMHGGGSGAGAQSIADGMDIGGLLAQPQNSIPDIEINELAYPVLYLWRQLNASSGGAGRMRGGNGVDLAWTPWYTPGGALQAFGACWQVPPPGVFGGYPGSSSGFTLVNGGHIDARLMSGQIPGSLHEMDGEVTELEGKQFGMTIAKGDVLHMHAGGGGGFGDPLDRPPDDVAADVVAGIISPAAASAAFGVVLAADGTADATATAARRQEIMATRLQWPKEQDGDALVHRSDLSARLAELGQWCQPRNGVELAEYADPQTGRLLRSEVRVYSQASDASG